MNGLKNVDQRYDDALSRVGWADLERLLAAYYRDVGWWVEHSGTGGSGARFDGGVDLRLKRDAQVVLVQCKHWNAKQVPHNAVHELLGIMVNERATGAILVSSGEFTPAAIEAAQRHGHVRLIDGAGLREMLGDFSEAKSYDGLRPYTGDADAASSGIGKRLPAAAEDGIRYDEEGRSAQAVPRTMRASLAWFFAKVLMIVVMIGLLWFGLTSIFRFMESSMVRGAESVSAAALSASQPQPQAHAPKAADAAKRSASPSVEARVPHRPAEAEIRASQRKSDEAMKVIEDATPEM